MNVYGFIGGHEGIAVWQNAQSEASQQQLVIAFQLFAPGGILTPQFSNAYSQAGIDNGNAALSKLSKANLSKCKDLLNQIGAKAGRPFSVSDLQSEAAKDVGFVYDGASSTVSWDVSRFGGNPVPGTATIGQAFSAPAGIISLSQGDGGHAIFIRSDTWGSMDPTTILFGLVTVFPAYNSAGGPTDYALATMLHEVMHKFGVGVGDTDLYNALGISAGDILSKGSKAITDALLNKCF